MYKDDILREFGPQKKKSPFCLYFRALVKQSLLTGIPAIVTTKSIIKKVVKSIVFLVCVAGFLYQTWEFLQMYFAYPTIVNVDIIKPEYIELPSVSFCILNRIKRSKVCDLDPDLCMDWEKENPNMSYQTFFKQYPIFNYGDRRTKFLILRNSTTHVNSSWEYQEMAGYTLKDVIEKCVIRTPTEAISCKNNITRFPALHPYGDPNFCFVVESLWGKPDEKARNVSTITSMELIIRTKPEEHIKGDMEPHASVHMHDARTLGNPMFQGMMFDGGQKFSIYVDVVRKELLPAPYRSNCKNYTQEWIKNNGTGPLNQKMCISKCRLDTSLKKGVCIHQTIFYPHKYTSCETGAINPLSENEMSKCYASCQEACEGNTYQMRADHTGDTGNCDVENFRCKSDKIRFDIMFQQTEVTLFKHQPKYASVEMFSYIGGYMGMWLGICLISLFDVLEIIFHLVCYPVMEKKGKRKKIVLRKMDRQYYQFPRSTYDSYYI